MTENSNIDPPHQTQLRVKPLEWRKGYCDERVTIHQASNGWLYQVRILDGVVWLDWPDRAATQFPSEEAAKEAVQTDYERRVLASLADSVAPPPQSNMGGGDELSLTKTGLKIAMTKIAAYEAKIAELEAAAHPPQQREAGR